MKQISQKVRQQRLQVRGAGVQRWKGRTERSTSACALFTAAGAQALGLAFGSTRGCCIGQAGGAAICLRTARHPAAVALAVTASTSKCHDRCPCHPQVADRIRKHMSERVPRILPPEVEQVGLLTFRLNSRVLANPVVVADGLADG